MHFVTRARKVLNPIALCLCLGASVGLSVLLMPTHGMKDVDDYWLTWMRSIKRTGLRNGYSASASDYPPLAFVLLSGVSRVATSYKLSPHAALKLSLWLFLAGTTLTFYLTTRKAELAIFLHAALILNSVALAYLDVYYIPTLLLSFWAIRRQRYAVGLFLFAVSCLIKFQPTILAPSIMLYLYHARQLRFRVIAPTLFLVGLALLAFRGDMVSAFVRASQNDFLSGDALNFQWIVTFAINVMILKRSIADVAFILIPPIAGLLLRLAFLGIYGFVLVKTPPRTFLQLLWSAALASLAYFTFSPGVHENHTVPALVALALLAANYQYLREFALFAVFANLNLLLFYGFDGQTPASWSLSLLNWLGLFLAIGMTAWFVYLLVTSRSTFARAAEFGRAEGV